MAPFPPTATCVLPMNAQQYYAIQDNPGFRSLLAQVMDQEVEVLDVWYKEDTKCEKVINRPNYEKWVPKIGRKFVKPDDIAFIDITEYSPRSQATAPYEMKIQSILPMMGDRVHIERVVVISEETASTCRHTITGDVSVRVPGVGRMVERYVMSNTVAAMNMLHTIVDRYRKVQEQLPKEVIPAELPGDLTTMLQGPYASDEDSEVSAVTVVHPAGIEEATSAGHEEAVSMKAEEHAVPAVPPGTAQPEQAARMLDRQVTKYFDADEAPWELDQEEADEEELEFVIEALSVEEEGEEIEAKDSPTEEDGGGESPRGRKLRRRDRPRHIRTKKFFSELRNLNLSSRRRHARDEAETLTAGARPPSEEVTRWNRDKERWDKLWRGARVRAAPIPKALAIFYYPLRLDKVGRALKVHPGSGEEKLGEDASAVSAEGTVTGRGSASSAVPKGSTGEEAFVAQQGPSLSREGSKMMARLRLKREMRGLAK